MFCAPNAGFTRAPLNCATAARFAAPITSAPAAGVCAIVLLLAAPITSPPKFTFAGATDNWLLPLSTIVDPSNFTAPNTVVVASGNCAGGIVPLVKLLAFNAVNPVPMPAKLLAVTSPADVTANVVSPFLSSTSNFLFVPVSLGADFDRISLAMPVEVIPVALSAVNAPVLGVVPPMGVLLIDPPEIAAPVNVVAASAVNVPAAGVVPPITELLIAEPVIAPPVNGILVIVPVVILFAFNAVRFAPFPVKLSAVTAPLD